MARLGNVKLSIERESDSSSVDATSYPVEKGIPFTDHVQEKPDEFTLTGSIIGDNYKSDKEYLKQEMKKGTFFTYVGRNIAKDVIILSIDGDVDSSIANGSNITIKLQSVRIASTPWVKVQNNGKKKPVSKTSSVAAVSAVYHVVKKGDTYWGCAKKYGTTVEALRKLNPWPDRSIPIGAKMRIK